MPSPRETRGVNYLALLARVVDNPWSQANRNRCSTLGFLSPETGVVNNERQVGTLVVNIERQEGTGVVNNERQEGSGVVNNERQ